MPPIATSSLFGAKPLILALTLVAGGWCVRRMAKARADPTDADATDPPLLRDHSRIRSYRTSRNNVVYDGVRVFYRELPKADEMPKDPAPLPLIVFIHGLGGSVAQFHPLLTSLTNVASCLAIDLPGCGRSKFSTRSWDAYTPEALIELIETIIDDYRSHDQGIILIGHSMGTALAARLANKRADNIMGLVAICPVDGPPPEKAALFMRKFLWMPECLFNLYRAFDRRGGLESASVRRFVGPSADLETRELQYQFNCQSRTPVFRRMAWGCLPNYVNGEPKGGLFGEPTWAGLNVPVYLIGGEYDTVTPPEMIKTIQELFQSPAKALAVTGANETSGSQDNSAARDDGDAAPGPNLAASKITFPDRRKHLPDSIDAISDRHFEPKQEQQVEVPVGDLPSLSDPTTPHEPHGSPGDVPDQPLRPANMITSTILPAGHALVFSPMTGRILAGLISDFLTEHITGRLSLGWQLQYLSREGKWDVKNLKKWKDVKPLSKPIAGIFRAMKTLREADEEHCPRVFASHWSHTVKDVIDISHTDPIYDPLSFGHGIKYHKFPTVSKIPPTDIEVAKFIEIVDKIREDQRKRAAEESWDNDYVIGVHCHYGFNRTGYFVVCYLIERCGYGVQEAIDAFAAARPNGIRHSHFLDNLHLRYSGIKK
ncbi:Alpha/Beta hydrolase protein [Xylariomycetidae sp. FL2044]|nr:Alpha/Beta hydrolase protein [Xylariomycetidae sp. FL2044]